MPIGHKRTQTKKAIKKAFTNQLEEKGLSIVEVLSSCPTNWGLAPNEALNWLRQNMMEVYPLGVYKDTDIRMEEHNK